MNASHASQKNGPASPASEPSHVITKPLEGTEMNAHSVTTPRRSAPAIDYHGELMDALSLLQCAYLVLDRGEPVQIDTCMDLLVVINEAQEKIRPVADMLADGGNHA